MFDLEGLIFFLVFFLITIMLGYGLLNIFNFNKRSLVYFMGISAIGHFIGAMVYCYFSYSSESDAMGYFNNAVSNLGGFAYLSTDLIHAIVYWLRYLIFGSSYLGTYAFFAMIGTLGSIFYLIIFCEFLERYKYFFWGGARKKMLGYAFLIACWPSSLFWASSIGKDSLCYFFIALFFLSLLNMKKKWFFIFLIISMIGMFAVRPYLFLVGTFAFFMWNIFSSWKKSSLLSKIILLIIISFLFFWLSGYVVEFCKVTEYSISGIANRAHDQQQFLSTGSSIDAVSGSPYLVFVYLPWTMFANLFLPIFVYAKSATGIIASFENLFLVILCIKFIKFKDSWKKLKLRYPLLGYMFWYFIFGIAVMGLVNTNLGIAAREKLMYLPVFLIIMFLTFIFRQPVDTSRVK